MNEIAKPPDQPKADPDNKPPGAQSPADSAGKSRADHADAPRAAEAQRARAAENAKFRDAYLANQKAVTATADHPGTRQDPESATKAARPRDSAALPARADHAEDHGQPWGGAAADQQQPKATRDHAPAPAAADAAATRNPGGQVTDAPGRNVSTGVLAEEVSKRTYFPLADWTSRNQKAVDLTADAKSSYSVYHDASGVNRIDEKRTGGEWIQVKVLQSDKPDKMPDNPETKVRQNVNLAMGKYIDLLDHPDSTGNSPKWQKYTEDTQPESTA